MAIDAVVDSIHIRENGDIKLNLISRDPKAGPAGQPYLIINQNPVHVPNIGEAIWGGVGQVILEDKKAQKRVFYDRNHVRIWEVEITDMVIPLPPDQLAV